MADGSTTTDETRGDDPASRRDDGSGRTHRPRHRRRQRRGRVGGARWLAVAAARTGAPPADGRGGPAADRGALRRRGGRAVPLGRGPRAPDDVVAGGELPVGRPDLPARQPDAASPAAGRGRQAAPAGSLGHDARPQLHLRAHEPRHHPARPRRDLRVRARARRSGRRGRRLARRHLQRGLRRHLAGRARDEAAVQAVQLSRRHPLARRARRRPAPSTRAASSATRSATPSAPPSTTPTSSSRASWATARPRRGRSRPPGTRTSSSTRAATARCCRSCTSTGTRSRIRRCSPASPRTS